MQNIQFILPHNLHCFLLQYFAIEFSVDHLEFQKPGPISCNSSQGHDLAWSFPTVLRVMPWCTPRPPDKPPFLASPSLASKSTSSTNRTPCHSLVFHRSLDFTHSTLPLFISSVRSAFTAETLAGRSRSTTVLECLRQLQLQISACQEWILFQVLFNSIQFSFPIILPRSSAFLAVQNSSIGHLVPWSVGPSDQTNNQSLHSIIE